MKNVSGTLLALHTACIAHPDQRVAQVIVNAIGDWGPDPFYVEDSDLADALWAYAKKGVDSEA